MKRNKLIVHLFKIGKYNNLMIDLHRTFTLWGHRFRDSDIQ